MKALVLCAGFGSRLGELGREQAKPLLTVGDRSIVEHILGGLAAAGCDEVFVNLHHHADRFPALLGDGTRFGLRIRYLHEPAPLGTAGTIKRLAPTLADAPLLVHYGDILTDHDLRGLWDRHVAADAWATIMVHQRAGSNSVALFGTGDRITTFVERPRVPVEIGSHTPWVFSGIAVLGHQAIAAIPDAVPADLAAHLLPELAGAGRLRGEPLAGFRCAIDSLARLEHARAAWADASFVPVTRTRP